MCVRVSNQVGFPGGGGVGGWFITPWFEIPGSNELELVCCTADVRSGQLLLHLKVQWILASRHELC